MSELTDNARLHRRRMERGPHRNMMTRLIDRVDELEAQLEAQQRRGNGVTAWDVLEYFEDNEISLVPWQDKKLRALR